MKKIRKILVFSLLIVVLGIMLFGCYDVKAGKMSKLKGTYKITECVHKQAVKDSSNNIEENYLEVKGIEAYIVITGGDIAYYIYKDKDTPVYCKEVKATYSYSENKSSLVEYFSYNEVNKDDKNAYAHPGSGYEKFGFNVKKKNLNYNTIPHKLGNTILVKDGYTVKYEKVDGATDLSYVEKKLNTKLNVVSYQMGRFKKEYYYTRAYEKVIEQDDPYIYEMYNINPETKQATRYYKLKSGEESTETNLGVTVLEVNDVDHSAIIKIGDKMFNLGEYGSMKYIGTDTVAEEMFYPLNETLESIKEMYIGYYNENKNSSESSDETDDDNAENENVSE